MTDEFHQSFVPGRSATITDVMVDSTGALIAWLLFRFVVPKVWKSASSS
jgi:VanZ family protein